MGKIYLLAFACVLAGTVFGLKVYLDQRPDEPVALTEPEAPPPPKVGLTPTGLRSDPSCTTRNGRRVCTVPAPAPDQPAAQPPAE